MKQNTAKAAWVGAYVLLSALLLINYSAYLDKPDGGSWDYARRYILASGCPDAPVVFRPDWLRNYATDHGGFSGINLAPCAGGCPAYWLLSLGDYTVPADYTPLDSVKAGSLSAALLVDSQESERMKSGNLISSNPEISLEVPGSEPKKCAFNGVLGRDCYSEDWQRIERRIMSSGGVEKPCLFVHPRDNTRISLLFRGVPLGGRLNLSTAIEDGLADGGRSRVYVEVYVGGDYLGKVVQPDTKGWLLSGFDTSKYGGSTSDVRLVVFADRDEARHFCLGSGI